MHETRRKYVLKKVGLNIKCIREEKGISLNELALKTGIRKKYIEKIEHGNAPKVSLTHLFKISKALKIDTCFLAEGV